MAVEINETDAGPGGDALRRPQALVAFGIAAGLLMIAWQCARYLLLGAYLDHIEGNVVISGWQFVHGAPLYESLGGAPLFATYYGPLAYLLEAPALALFGAGVTVSKITSLLALAATLAVMSWHFRRRPAGGQRLDGMLLLIAGLLFFCPVSYWVRPDPIETLLVALGVASARSRSGAVGLGICIGLAVNLKVHAFMYFLPIVVDLWSSSGWRSLARMAVASGLTFLLPFLAPGISLQDYVTTLATQIGHRAHAHSAQPFVDGIVLIGVPGLLVAVAMARQAQRTVGRERLYFCGILATLALLAYPATFPGAGLYHLAPFVPVLADAFHRLRADNLAARWAPVMLLVAGVPSGVVSLRAMEQMTGWGVIADEALVAADRDAGQTIQVGYGDNPRSYQISQLSKTVLALNGHPAMLDAQVLMELRYIGIDGSMRWLPDLADCRFGRWLLPKHEEPFAVTSYYDGGPLFDDEFRRVFLERYELVGSTAHFDVWACAGNIAPIGR
jgi:hypothetical protein